MIPKIEIEGPSVNAIEQVLSSKNVRLATKSTINKLAAQGSTAVSKAVRSKYIITAKDLKANGNRNRNGLSVRKAAAINDSAFILGAGKPLPVYRFRVSPKTPEAFRARKRGKGVTYTVRKGRKVRVPSAFVARMPSGHVGVFQRTTRGRTPIRELFGPSIPQMLSETDSLRSIQELIASKGPKIYEHELRFRLSKLFK